jgi:hypothetical protein
MADDFVVVDVGIFDTMGDVMVLVDVDGVDTMNDDFDLLVVNCFLIKNDGVGVTNSRERFRIKSLELYRFQNYWYS